MVIKNKKMDSDNAKDYGIFLLKYAKLIMSQPLVVTASRCDHSGKKKVHIDRQRE